MYVRHSTQGYDAVSVYDSRGRSYPRTADCQLSIKALCWFCANQ